MILRFAAFFLGVALLAQADEAGFPSRPFATVIRQGNTIVATLPMAGPRYQIPFTSAPRSLSPGESFELHDGPSIFIAEKHASYDITCEISPRRAGLHIRAKFDDRVYGDTQRKYFVNAQ